MRTCLPAAALLASSLSCFAANPKPTAPPPAPFGPVPTARQIQWHEMEQYAFAHFSVNTFADKEWGFGNEQEAVFNPTAFDAGQIVRAAKSAGMKGLILTAKHHDGFCLWPAKSTPHNITASPYKKGKGDIVREMADACKQEGLKFGVYVSPWDRNHADYGGPGYVQAYHAQIRELATGYGPIFEMWFDGASGGSGFYGGKGGSRRIDYNTYYGWKEIRAMIRELQPDCAIWCGQYAESNRLHWADSRWGGSEGGDVGEPCWNAVDSKVMNAGEMWSQGRRNGDLWCPAEGDVSIRPGWFWHESQNGQVKSPEKLMEIYLSCVGRGANLILNMPPDRRGQLHENDLASLKGYGDHLRQTFAVNLAADAKMQASNTRSHDGLADPFYGPQRLVDADRWSAWVTDDDVHTAEAIMELAGEKTFNLIRLREDIRLGQRVEGVTVDAWDAQAGGAWKEIAKAQSVGANRLWRVPKTTAGKLRLQVTRSPVAPALSDFGLFMEPEFEALKR